MRQLGCKGRRGEKLKDLQIDTVFVERGTNGRTSVMRTAKKVLQRGRSSGPAAQSPSPSPILIPLTYINLGTSWEGSSVGPQERHAILIVAVRRPGEMPVAADRPVHFLCFVWTTR